jgi:GT2 family glycosyltransferase
MTAVPARDAGGKRALSELVAVVVITRDRVTQLLESLPYLVALPGRPRIVVVDNASTDGTAPAVRERFPEVEVIRMATNLGGGGRNVGARAVDTPYVAFCDDDEWWSPGSLERAVEVLDACPNVGLLASRIVVEPDGRTDPTCALMARSPLGDAPHLPGPRVRGFLAGGSVVRRRAFLDAGGFDARFVVGGEEALLACDLASAGWELVYVDELELHHRPSAVRDVSARRRREQRNALWTAWLRRPASDALRLTGRTIRAAVHDRDARYAIAGALRGGAWVMTNRRPVSQPLARELRTLDGDRDESLAGAHGRRGARRRP